MSRIGKQPIPVPSSVKVDINGTNLKITGRYGTLEKNIRPEISLEVADGLITVKCLDNSKRTRILSGLTRTLVNNMILGTERIFNKKLILEGVGYKVDVQNNELTLNVGYSNPVVFKLPTGIIGKVEKTTIYLEGIDKELLGLTAAKIRNIRKPEPYKGKGIRYESEHVFRKPGKSASK